MRTYIYALIASVAVYFVHIFGTNGGYVAYPWLDLVSHGAVGLVLGLLLVAFSSRRGWKRPSQKIIIIYIVFFVGLLWEIFEVVFDVSGHPFGTRLYYIDTIKDLIVDMVGAMVAIFFNREKLHS